MTILPRSSPKSLKVRVFPLQMSHRTLITNCSTVESYRPDNSTSLSGKVRSQGCGCCAQQSLQNVAPGRQCSCCSLQGNRGSVSGKPLPRAQDHPLPHGVGAPGQGQQQLRLGSDGCLRSLKPFPPDAGLASEDGILRLISMKSSLMLMAFLALVSTKMAWMESA